MNNEECENKEINEKKEIIYKLGIKPSSFELIQKVDLSFLFQVIPKLLMNYQIKI